MQWHVGFEFRCLPMWRLATALGNCWLGNANAAHVDLLAAREWIAAYGAATWLNAFEGLVQSEMAWAQQDWQLAEAHVEACITVAGSVESESFACLGHLVASQVFEAQGKAGAALEELRRLARRKQTMHLDGLEGRARVVKWQVEMRRVEHHLERAQESARKFEQLSLQDALTGIANRRCFEERIQEWLPVDIDAGLPLHIAVIDVDQFKRVNDCFSHHVGDEVLKAIAQLLVQNVRTSDLAARLAGDEFVIALRHAEDATATQICERVVQAVAEFDWNSIAPGLSVGVSLGLAQSPRVTH